MFLFPFPIRIAAGHFAWCGVISTIREAVEAARTTPDMQTMFNKNLIEVDMQAVPLPAVVKKSFNIVHSIPNIVKHILHDWITAQMT